MSADGIGPATRGGEGYGYYDYGREAGGLDRMVSDAQRLAENGTTERTRKRAAVLVERLSCRSQKS